MLAPTAGRWVLLLAALLAACGGRVVIDGAPSGTGGDAAGSSSGSSGTGDAWTVQGPGGCPHTEDQFTMSAVAPDGTMIACPTPGMTGEVTFSGFVTAAGTTGVTVDTCPPGTACDPSEGTLGFYAPGLVPIIPNGTIVSVEVSVVETTFGCAGRLLIKNLPVLGAATNPTAQDSGLWLAAGDGTLTTFADAPFQLAQTPACNTPNPDGSEDRKLELIVPGSPGLEPHTVDIPMGDGAGGPGPSGESWDVRNLRSFGHPGLPSSAADMDFAYWILRAY